ncbi:MAG: hypothetical protein ABEL97_01060 [Salinibacter sp.]
MVANQHFQRLKRIYASGDAEPSEDRIAISYGRAELEGTIDGVQARAIVEEMPHHRLLSDAAALAAGSLEKEHYVTAEQFTIDIVESEYEGPVVASAEVVMAEPPRYVVQAVMVDDEGERVAEAQGVFRPGDNDLPPAPAADDETAPSAASTPPPASFMPVHTTPYGIVCLN